MHLAAEQSGFASNLTLLLPLLLIAGAAAGMVLLLIPLWLRLRFQVDEVVTTLLLMGLSTLAIGLLPTTGTIGIAAPILLVVLRILQGLGAGAEFGGASTLLAEHAPAERRGFFTSFAQTGVQLGLLSGTLVFLLVETLPRQTVLDWAWRIPFWFSFALIAVALYVRLRVAESPVFQRMARQRTTVELPVFDALRRSFRSRRCIPETLHQRLDVLSGGDGHLLDLRQ